MTPERLTGHVVLIGYGRVGRRIAEALREHGLTFVVADLDREVIEGLRERGYLAISGDATDPAVMVQTHVQRARVLVIATPDALGARQMIDIARRLNPLIEVIARSHSDEEDRILSAERDTRVFMGEKELAASMTRHLLDRLATVEERVQGRTTLR